MASRTAWLVCLIFTIVSHASVILVRAGSDIDRPCHDVEISEPLQQHSAGYKSNTPATTNDRDADLLPLADSHREERVPPQQEPITTHQHTSMDKEQQTEPLSTSVREDLKKRRVRRSPSEEIAVVPAYGQCGGRDYQGLTICEFGTTCCYKDVWYSQCEYDPTPPGLVDRWGQCGGVNYVGPTVCRPDTVCRYQDEWYSQCV